MVRLRGESLQKRYTRFRDFEKSHAVARDFVIIQ